MSWSFSIQKATKAAAKQAVSENPNVKEWKYCPPQVVAAIEAAIDAFPEPGAKDDIHVSTSGHVRRNEDGSISADGAPYANITVKFVERAAG